MPDLWIGKAANDAFNHAITGESRHDAARTVFRYGPFTAALIYPLLLVSLHQSGRHFVQATDATGKLLAGLAVGLSAALVYSVCFSPLTPIGWITAYKRRLSRMMVVFFY